MNMIRLICPNCGANLSVSGDGGREYCFCEYCGVRIRLHDPNTTTYRYVDEARIREAELNARLREKELDLRLNREDEFEKKSEFNRNFFKKRIFIYIVLTVLCFILNSFSRESSNFWALFLGMMGVYLVFFGSVGHAIALLVKRKRYK